MSQRDGEHGSGREQVEARDAAKHTKVTRITPTAENYPDPVLPRLNNFDTDQIPSASSELNNCQPVLQLHIMSKVTQLAEPRVETIFC